MKRLLSVLLTIVTLFGACLCLTGCGVDPYQLDTWYLMEYKTENGEMHSAGFDPIRQTFLKPEAITIRYFEDGTFIFKEFDREYTGTYNYKKGKSETKVSLTFSDGSQTTGTCAQYMFDGTWYRGSLKAFGKVYFFEEKNRWSEEEENDALYLQVGEIIKDTLDKRRTEGYVSCYEAYTLYKGQIELFEEEYRFVPQNPNDTKEQNLSQAYSVYSYEVAEDFSVTRGDNILREGRCFINYATRRVEVSSGEFEWKYEYAVWYY